MKLVHWPLMGGLLRFCTVTCGLDKAAALLTVPNVTVHPSTASVPITILLYNGPLLCGFSVPIEGLTLSVGCPEAYQICSKTSVSKCYSETMVCVYILR